MKAMAGKLPQYRSSHEAAHAVIARKFGCDVGYVEARPKNPHVQTPSLAYAAVVGDQDTDAQIAAYGRDAIIALAGLEANRRDVPRLTVFDLFDTEDGDIVNARSAIFKIDCLAAGKPIPDFQGAAQIELNQDTMARMDAIYDELRRKTAELVSLHWAAIGRVGKHLERHGRINSQAELDDLIMRGEYVSSIV
jgi:hypothetical protein